MRADAGLGPVPTRVGVRVDVCVSTRARPVGLAQLLAALAGQVFGDGDEGGGGSGLDGGDGAPAPDVRIVVVDNDAVPSAREVVEAARAGCPWPIAYGHQPRPGIAIARNASVALARADADAIAFVDDDEEPEPDWLARLLAARRAYGTAAVAGPVLPRFATAPPRWVARGRFFDRPRPRSGELLPYVGTGNVLVDAAALRSVHPVFDERLALSGGEDTHLFMRFVAAGHRIAWTDDAIVHEDVPASRVRTSWILRRAYRGGNAFARCEAMVWPSRRVRARRAARGCFRLLRGAALVLASPVRGQRAGAVRGLQLLVNGAGVLTGLAGREYHEYTTTHGA